MTHQQYLEAFENEISEMLNITTRKNRDYANEDDALQNFQLCEEIGVTSAERGILVRMTDKLQRISNLLDHDPHVVNERIEDSLLDLANYSIILLIYLKNKKSTLPAATPQ